MDFKKITADANTQTRDMNAMWSEVGNVYETVAIIAKRANQINTEMKHELDQKLQEFANANQDSGVEEVFENKEQIELSRYYERLPKPHMIATQEFIDHKIIYRNPLKEKEEEL
ncbi:MAG: DNA-directed RNA polymerase subunit omega [Paludibacteraceae bacterium]|nr:DNA-directed RNA polymerase subunit omega [Paludibacteraceae bacterium]